MRLTKWAAFLLLAAFSNAVFPMSDCSKFLLESGAKVEHVPITKVAFPFKNSVTKFDPHVVPTTTEANLARNLYSRVVNLDDDGQISPGLAKGIQWRDDRYQLEIRSDTYTADGYKIGPYDVYISLLRNVIINKNTHGSLRNFLCPRLEMPSIDSGCSGLSYDEKFVYLRPVDESKKLFLIPLLASADFSIIPSGSIDLKSANLRVTDYRNTSGPYYVEKDDDGGRLTWHVNVRNYLYDANMPQIIELVPAYGKESFQLFMKGDVDVILTINGGDKSDFLEAGKAGASIHETFPIKLYLLRSTSVGRERHSQSDLMKAGLILQERLLKDYEGSDFLTTKQFFPKGGEGHLDIVQERKLEALLKRYSGQHPRGKFVFGIHHSQKKIYEEKFKNLTFIELRTYGAPPWLAPPDEQPDFYLSNTDASFYENVSLIYYNFSMGSFGDPSEVDDWLNEYMSEEDRGMRMEKLNALHFDSLVKGRIFPLAFSSYMAIARNPLFISMSKLYAGSPLWKLKKQSLNGQ